MATKDIPEAERVTLISSDNQEFVIDIKSARKSGFIRSMLGDGPVANKSDAAARSVKEGQTSSAAAAQRAAAMTALGTPPPETRGDEQRVTSSALDAAADGRADPEGYVNPFASNDAGGDETKDSDEDRMGLDGGFAEAKSNTVHLSNIRGVVLEKVVEYLDWNAKYSDAPKDVDIPPFEPRIPPDLALELLIAADYLET